MDKVLHSSKNHDWETPETLIKLINEHMGPIALDPCSNERNPTGAAKFLTPADNPDGLEANWAEMVDGRLIYMNPPYGRSVKDWVQKAIRERLSYSPEYDIPEILALLASRTGTSWFQTASRSFDGACFIAGRLRFRGAESAAPFDSVLLYWGHRKGAFDDLCERLGFGV